MFWNGFFYVWGGIVVNKCFILSAIVSPESVVTVTLNKYIIIIITICYIQ